MLKRFRDKKVDGDWLHTNFPCMMACPAHTNAGRYVGLIAEGRFEEAYRLARDPHEITALEVIRGIDGPIILTQCFTEHDEPVECDQSELCPVREPLRKVHEGILRLLSGITISDLSSDDMPIPAIHGMVSSIEPLSRPISR